MSDNTAKLILNLVPNLLVFIAVLVAGYAMVTAIRSGLLTKFRIGPLEFRRETAEARALIRKVAAPDREPLPFETEELAKYYGSVLAQSKTSFWFSLMFASLGFMVIIVAVFVYTRGTAPSGTSYLQLLAGVIIDATGGLFFVQSQRAQAAMANFFDKLRRDRLQAESRKLCDGVEDVKAKDALRILLCLHYAEVQNSFEVAKSINETCFGQGPVPSPGDNGRRPSPSDPGTTQHVLTAHPSDSAAELSK